MNLPQTNTIATEFDIVEYNPSYAAGVAAMWNVSSSGWNDRDWSTNPEAVRNSEATSTHLNLFLAVLKSEPNKVVGYCKLSKYSFDVNTLYIDLLNVDPVFHGAKVGKQLVLAALKRTIELGYPRLDLFTWAGNTKAVPLYKKCGFFWEKMDKPTTHLMNFMPQVFSNPLCLDYFKEAMLASNIEFNRDQLITWAYDHSQRIILKEPDGESFGSKGDFDRYEYSWKNGDRVLKVHFEKTGRGIQGLSSPNLNMNLEIPANRLVFGKGYLVQLTIENTSDADMVLSVSGQSTEGVKTLVDFDGILPPKQSLNLMGTLDLSPNIEEQDPWKTHPSAQVQVVVNGAATVLEVGVNIVNPLKLTLDRSNQLNKRMQLPLLKPIEIVLNLENNSDRDWNFTLDLPKIEGLLLCDSAVTASLSANERKSFILIGQISKTVIYSGLVDVAGSDDTQRIEFKTELSLILEGTDGWGSGQTKNGDYLINGKYKLYTHTDHSLNMSELSQRHGRYNIACTSPQFSSLQGPYSSELNREKPHRYSEEHMGGVWVKRHHYVSKEMQGLAFARCYSLSASGQMKLWFELEALPKGMDAIRVNQRLILEGSEFVLPYDGQVLELNNVVAQDGFIAHLKEDKLFENWLLAKTRPSGDSTLGQPVQFALVWPQELKPQFCDWYLAFEATLTEQVWQSPAIEVHVDTFTSTEDIRQYAHTLLASHNANDLSTPASTPPYFTRINGGNPIWSTREEALQAEFVDLREKPIHAHVAIHLEGGEPIFNRDISKEEDLNQVACQIPLVKEEALSLVHTHAHYGVKGRTQRQLVLCTNLDKSVEVNEGLTEGHSVFTVNNGFLQYQASSTFGPCVFDVSIGNRHYLASDFPQVSSKSWFNPWLGGIGTHFNTIPNHQWHKEKHEIEPVLQRDNFNNPWQGIAITTHVDLYKPFKGMKLTQYFLTLPNLPLLLTYEVLSNEAGKAIEETLYQSAFLNASKPLLQYEFKGQWLEAMGGQESIDELTDRILRVRIDEPQATVHQYKCDLGRQWFCADQQVTYTETLTSVHILNQQEKVIKPNIFIFGDYALEDQDFCALKHIQFKGKSL